MKLTPLNAISPIDGRYAEKCDVLRPIFSEFGLMRFRILVEIRWLQTLANLSEFADIPSFQERENEILNAIVENFNEHDAQRIKEIEKKINHDVKAVEYFLKEQFAAHPQLKAISEFIHFACTSEDINNLAYALMLKKGREQFLLPLFDKLITTLRSLAHHYADIPMLARTHGQAATPTTVGKEFANYAARLTKQYDQFARLEIFGKFNGAVGNFNAHKIAYPQLDWLKISQQFVEGFELAWNKYTTQIEPHDYIAEFCHNLMRINTIAIDLDRDMWGYISLDYFKQRMTDTEVGSSTMPHKVNPIDFENSEGNLAFANALFDFFARQLPTSRWQRDLVDSTILRNLGSGIAHTFIAYQALLKGLNKLAINEPIIAADLNQHWEVLTEAIQTVMRAHGLEVPYERLKALSRGKVLDQDTLQNFIKTTELPVEIKERLYKLSPGQYSGLASQLAKEI